MDKFDCLDIASFWMQVRPTKGPRFATIGKCWLWQGSKTPRGYGRFFYHQKEVKAHRLAFFLYNGNIAEEKFICHKCDTPSCVNPKHLYQGTPQDNIRDRDERGRHRRRGRTRNKSTSSDFFGVYFRKDSNRWRVIISINKKICHFGNHHTEKEAALKYDKVVKELNLELPLNFPSQPPQKALNAL